ncbi:hypothetical protein EN836_20855 [Mesorhizobium sp. M1C.F.Ca.ET.193.01.1.1]|uniref:hypothetical protein n=1 Tax=unclassified Mesorhizobium TaxID=325217 RepID=UPI000FD3E2F7|nr:MULTISPECIES: hypothetical protein [unclassified Mesorhizobium]TGS96394.1 hypothetical protein EN820_41885 [bacterium M00.F.Ca.ET.177.01.1.1]TGQ52066.1 hypothetical protein EN853_20845 [Mesorhizobium sp. M1C.F.Ca.ET.210.01.1.1]TGQ68711.1 hypothetical protein EN855_020855 [Mesorhizobium sp. M1C.F.Ca.ET.212.01.1.1]TGR04125.1 hypothetical protein EN847_21155 [Mesorhizobium sp. M1C.F.Ca.ET.204.01.1.1]TGR24789.1 hypothetical protein EN839_21155 [Mesorhizobium sp. M1C.F.Ca.ET.196.01.1.1]
MQLMTTGMALAMLTLAGAAHAADCVDAKSAKAGFVLEKSGIRSEFRPAPGGMVAVANEYEAQSPQTQYLYAGLIEVFRDSDTGRLSMIPLGDIKKLFPLKAGAKSKTEFVRLSAKKTPKGTETLALAVKGKETYKLGDCTYNVLAVKETITGDSGAVIDSFTALYSPDLQAVLAKRYDEGTSSQSEVGFETIRPLKQ